MNRFTEGNIFDYIKSTNGTAKIADFHQVKTSVPKPIPIAKLETAAVQTTTSGHLKKNNSLIYWTLGMIAVVTIVVGVDYYLKKKKEAENKIKKFT